MVQIERDDHQVDFNVFDEQAYEKTSRYQVHVRRNRHVLYATMATLLWIFISYILFNQNTDTPIASSDVSSVDSSSATTEKKRGGAQGKSPKENTITENNSKNEENKDIIKINKNVNNAKSSETSLVSTHIVFAIVIFIVFILSALILVDMKKHRGCIRWLMSIRHSTFRNPSRESALRLVESLEGKKEITAVPLVAYQIQALVNACKCHLNDADSFSRALTDMPRVTGQPRRDRSLQQLLVNLLLAVGIIGTFYGLIQFLSNEQFQLVLSNPTSITEVSLVSIATSFQIAFGTSLLAYGVHSGGRFMVDILEEDMEATWSIYHEQLLLPLIHAFPLRTAETRLNWDRATRDSLRDMANAISTASNEIRQTRNEFQKGFATLDEQASSLTKAANATALAATAAGEAATRVANSAQTITTESKATGGIVKEGADIFRTAATDLTGIVDNMAGTLTGAREELEKASAALGQSALKAGEALASNLVKAGQSMQTTMTASTVQLSEATENLKSATHTAGKSFETMRETLDSIASLAVALNQSTSQSGSQIRDAVTSIREDMRNSLIEERTLIETLNNSLANQDQVLRDVCESLEKFRELVNVAMNHARVP